MRIHRAIIAFCITGALAGCAATQQASEVEQSGFLGKRHLCLAAAGSGRRERHADLRQSERRPRQVREDHPRAGHVLGGARRRDRAAPEDRKTLADATFAAFHEQLSKDYEIVQPPGPATMVVALAITNVEAGDATLNTVSSVVPQARLLRGAASFVTDKPAFVGELAGESKVTDSVAGELLGAGVDQRFGSQRPEITTDLWEDALDIIEYWSQVARYRFCRARGDTGCRRPET